MQNQKSRCYRTVLFCFGSLPGKPHTQGARRRHTTRQPSGPLLPTAGRGFQTTGTKTPLWTTRSTVRGSVLLRLRVSDSLAGRLARSVSVTVCSATLLYCWFVAIRAPHYSLYSLPPSPSSPPTTPSLRRPFPGVRRRVCSGTSGAS